MKRNGFTLIEVMIALAIVATLAAIAFPAYTQYLRKSHKANAQQFLLTIASREHQYMLDARQYTDSLTALGLNVPAEIDDKYSFTITDGAGDALTATDSSFRIAAAPRSTGVMKCTKTLRVNSLGVKDEVDTAGC